MFTHFVLHMKVQCTSNVLASFYVVDIYVQFTKKNTTEEIVRGKIEREQKREFTVARNWINATTNVTETLNNRIVENVYQRVTQSTSEMREKKNETKKKI